jgi:chromosome segregation ATPase
MPWLLFCMVCTMPLYAQSTTQPEHLTVGQLGSRHPQLEMIRAELDHVRKKYDEQRSMVADLTEVIREATGRIEVSADLLHQAAAKLDDQLMELELEDAAGKARMDAVLNELGKLEHATTRVSDQDIATAELEKVVAVRQKQYDTIVKMRATAAISQNEVEEAAAQLAEAKARAAVQREQAVAAAGGDTIIALRKELTDLTITQEDRNARLQYLAKQRDGLRNGLRYVDKLQQAEAEVHNLQSRIDELEKLDF